jgi:hypothetical protein
MRMVRVVFALPFVVCSAAFGVNNRSAVSVAGSDSATCAVADPCRSFAVAIMNTVAGGEVIVLSSGGYGPFSIDKSIAVISPLGYHAAITATTGNAITITASNAKVVIRNLYLNSLGAYEGVDISDLDASVVNIEHVTVNNFQYGVFAIALPASTTRLFIDDSDFRDCGVTGIYAVTVRVSIDRTRLKNNNVGVDLRTNAILEMNDSSVLSSAFDGIHVGSNVVATVNNTVSSQNGSYGFVAVVSGKLTASNCVASNNETGFRAESSASLAAHHCVASDNANGFLEVGATAMTVSDSLAIRNLGDGIAAITGGSVYISGNTVTGNGTGVHNNSALIESVGNNIVRGNTANVTGLITGVPAN